LHPTPRIEEANDPQLNTTKVNSEKRASNMKYFGKVISLRKKETTSVLSAYKSLSLGCEADIT
jgi:hypothetical protein